jgi:hypothetical protein
MTTRVIFWLIAAILAGATGVGTFVYTRRDVSTPVVQPIPFNHEKHVSGKPKLACTVCHPGAEREARAGLPSLARCLSCHMKPQSQSAGEARVRELAMQPVWPRFTALTANHAHVFFSHRAHVGTAGMSCARCHGDVAHWTEPPTEPAYWLQSMDLCLDCHRKEGASTRCITCHR